MFFFLNKNTFLSVLNVKYFLAENVFFYAVLRLLVEFELI